MPPQPPLPPRRIGFRPTPDQWTFGKIVSDIAQSDFNLCAILSDTPAPQNWKVTDADPKDKLVPAVKASLDFCSQALASLQDSKLGDTVKFFGGRHVSPSVTFGPRFTLQKLIDLGKLSAYSTDERIAACVQDIVEKM